MGKIAIHGFGRIGRSTLKAVLKRNLFVPAAENIISSSSGAARALQFI